MPWSASSEANGRSLSCSACTNPSFINCCAKSGTADILPLCRMAGVPARNSPQTHCDSGPTWLRRRRTPPSTNCARSWRRRRGSRSASGPSVVAYKRWGWREKKVPARLPSRPPRARRVPSATTDAGEGRPDLPGRIRHQLGDGAHSRLRPSGRAGARHRTIPSRQHHLGNQRAGGARSLCAHDD